jgi:hypothetical protein
MRGSRRRENKKGLDDDRRTLIHRYMVEKEEPPEPKPDPPTPVRRQQGEPLLDQPALESEVLADPGAVLGLKEPPEPSEEITSPQPSDQDTQPALRNRPRHLVGLDRPSADELISFAALEPTAPADPAPPLVDLQPAAPPLGRHERSQFQVDASRGTLHHVARLCEQLSWARDESVRHRQRLAAARPLGDNSSDAVRVS